VSTPSKPDDPDPASDSESSGTGGTRTSTEEAARPAESAESAESSTTRVAAVEEDGEAAPDGPAAGDSRESGEGSGSGSGAASGSASGPAGPPPPWQRGGASSGPTGPPSGPLPAGGRPAGPPAGGPSRPGPGGPGGPGGPHPPSGPFPRPGGPGPQGRPAEGQVGPPSGGIPMSVRMGPASGTARPTSTGEGGPAGRTGATTASGIDAPTNQLSPEQLGLRGRDEEEPRREPDDVAELSAGRPRTGKAPRRASLQVRRFDPWSVLKLALVLGVALFFVWMFAVGVLYAVLDGMGVWAQLNGTYQDLTSDAGGNGELITAGGVFGVAAVIGVVNIILFTALASVSAFIYNISADVAGGIEVTLSERD
jgi:hypothetical protein